MQTDGMCALVDHDSAEATVSHFIDRHDDISAADTRMALGKIVNENATLRREIERLSAELRKDMSEQGPSRAQRELLEELTLQVQQLHRENTMLRDLGKSGSPEEAPPRPDRPRQDPDEDPFVKLLGEYISQKDNENMMRKAGVTAQRRRSHSRRNSTNQQEPRQSVPVAGAPDDMVGEVNDIIAKLYLSALLRERKFQKITELLEVIDEKGQFHNGRSIAHMVKEALFTYLRSQDFQSDPDKLVSRLQDVGCSFAPKLIHSSIHRKRHSAPASIVEKTNAESTQARPLSVHIPTSVI